MLAESFQPTHL